MHLVINLYWWNFGVYCENNSIALFNMEDWYRRKFCNDQNILVFWDFSKWNNLPSLLYKGLQLLIINVILLAMKICIPHRNWIHDLSICIRVFNSKLRISGRRFFSKIDHTCKQRLVFHRAKGASARAPVEWGPPK